MDSGLGYAPTQAVTLDDGSSIELRDLYASRPLGLVFLRHLGCLFCREIVARLRDVPEENLVFVAGERAEACAEFRVRMVSPQRFVSDPGRSLYEAFQLGRGGLGAFVNPHVVRRGIAALRAGHRQSVPTSNPRQLGGAFVVDTEGRIVWEHRSRDQADNPDASEIQSALREAALAPVAMFG